MKRMKQAFFKEWEKVRRLGGRAGAEYIWQYYHLWIIGIGFLLGFAIFLLTRFLTTPSKTAFYLILANTREEAGSGSALWEGYIAYSGYDPKEEQVVFNSDSYFNYARDQGRGNVYYNFFAGLVDAGVLDAVTMETDALTALGTSGRLLDLNREECASIRRKYGDRFLYAIPLNREYSDSPVPVGIDISGSSLAGKYHVYEGGCALGVGAGTGRLEAVELFLDYIFSEEG